MADAASEARRAIDAVYRSDSRRVLATLIRLLGDFDLAEEALHDAFAAALEKWPEEGLPLNPRAWLISAGRFKAIDRLRRRARLDARLRRSPAGSRTLRHSMSIPTRTDSSMTGSGSSSRAAIQRSVPTLGLR